MDFLRTMLRSDPDMSDATLLHLVHLIHRIRYVEPLKFSYINHANAMLLLAEMSQKNFRLVFPSE